jgi:hypothetical protein
MMAYLLKAPEAYGFSQPLISITPIAQTIAGVPSNTKGGVLGQLQIDTLTGAVYMLTAVVDGLSIWTALGGGASTPATLAVTGNATIGGTLDVAGNVVMSGSLDVVGSITSGNNITAAAAVTAGTSLYTFGDDGAGTAGSTEFTNTLDDTQGAGALTIVSTTAGDGTNTGFIGIWVGTVRAWVPYFTDIAP